MQRVINKAIERIAAIRRDPMRYKDREDVKRRLKGLEPTVQKYADVLEENLSEYSK